MQVPNATAGRALGAQERAPVGQVVGLQRLDHLTSLTVMRSATASAIWLSRWWMKWSVLRRSCPKFGIHEFVRSTGQRIPSDTDFFATGLPFPGLRFFAATRSSIPNSAHRARTMLVS